MKTTWKYDTLATTNKLLTTIVVLLCIGIVFNVLTFIEINEMARLAKMEINGIARIASLRDITINGFDKVINLISHMRVY